MAKTFLQMTIGSVWTYSVWLTSSTSVLCNSKFLTSLCTSFLQFPQVPQWLCFLGVNILSSDILGWEPQYFIQHSPLKVRDLFLSSFSLLFLFCLCFLRGTTNAGWALRKPNIDSLCWCLPGTAADSLTENLEEKKGTERLNQSSALDFEPKVMDLL